MSRTIITNVRIIDGTGAPAIENGAFVMRHIQGELHKDYIEFVGPMAEFKPEKYGGSISKNLDLPGHTLLPGLINVHTHLDIDLPYLPYLADLWGDAYRSLVAYRRAGEALRCGVTTLRNVGCAGNVDIALQKAVEKNLLWGPRIVACAGAIAPHAGHGASIPGTLLCTGKTQFMHAVRQNIALGANQIKLMYTGGLAGAGEGINDIQITREELQACIEVAHGAGKKVLAHLSCDEAIRFSVQLGVDCVEHAYTLSEDTAKLMAEKGTYLVPTLCVSSAGSFLRAHGAPEYTLEKLEQSAKTHKTSIQNAIRAGVCICTGTDLLPSDPIDGTNPTVREAELLVEAGLSPLQAITAATANGARLCGLGKETGSLKAGMQGDIIVVQGSPDKDISHLRQMCLVAKGCRLVWSSLPQMQLDRFSPLPPGYTLEGGSFPKW